MTDENGFFTKAAMGICGSLDIGVASWRCLACLQDAMPADVMTIHLSEPGLGTLRTIAKADVSGGEGMDDVVILSPEARSSVREIQMKNITIINDTSANPLARCVHDHYGDPICSALVMPLVIDQKELGGITLRAFGKNRYTDRHAGLFLRLKNPFAIALSNTLKHKEITQMKEMLVDENRYLRAQLQQASGKKSVGISRQWKSVMEMVRLVGPLDTPVMLLGETGVGKEIVANALHSYSLRKDAPFIKVNCGALPEGLLDTTLFGHEKGAFTGAVSSRKGLFERANHGTIFLDEIGDMPMHAQVRLLRVLQNKELERVGGITTVSVNTRIIAACQEDLEELVKANRFRSDLRFRLNVFPITIPPLRERKDDIPVLVHNFVTTKARELRLKDAPEFSPGAIDNLMEYDWPGNVRELENVLERALILSRGKALIFESLLPSRKTDEIPLCSEQKHDVSKLDQLIRRHIQSVLRMTCGKVYGPEGAADVLGVNANTLRNRMDKLGIVYKRRDSLSA